MHLLYGDRIRFALALGQVCSLNPAYGAVGVDCTLCTEGNTGALLLCAAVRLLTCITAVVRVADFTNKGAGLSLAALGVTAILRMFGVVFA